MSTQNGRSWPGSDHSAQALRKCLPGLHIFNMSGDIDLFQQRRSHRRNRLHTWLLGGGSLLLLAATAWALAGPTGDLYAVVFGLASLWMLGRASPEMVLKMYKAREATRSDFPVGLDIVQNLSGRAGLSVAPKLYIIASPLMNAFAVGRRGNAAIAITDALARQLSGRELTGVLAHEISHVAHDDIKVMALADVVSRFTSLWSTFGMVAAFFNFAAIAGGGVAAVPWSAVVLLLFAPTIGSLLQMGLSRTREFDADLSAVMLTGDPDGLASALGKLEKAQGRAWEGLALPARRMKIPSALRSHPQTAARVARLAALKAEGQLAVLIAEKPAMPQPAIRPGLVPRIRPGGGADRAALMPLSALPTHEPRSHDSA